MDSWEAGHPPPVREIPPEVYEVTAYLRAARDAAGWTNASIDALFDVNGMAGHWTSAESQPAVPSVRDKPYRRPTTGIS
jgi:site-specific DNA-methyltransferase (adenine-specific)